MLPRAHRLSDHHEVSRVFRMGRKAYGSLFSFTFLPNTLGSSRFTVVVGKKVAARAIERNRIKRLTREALQALLPRLAPGFDGAFRVLRKPTSTPTSRDVLSEIETLLRQTPLLR